MAHEVVNIGVDELCGEYVSHRVEVTAQMEFFGKAPVAYGAVLVQGDDEAAVKQLREAVQLADNLRTQALSLLAFVRVGR